MAEGLGAEDSKAVDDPAWLAWLPGDADWPVPPQAAGTATGRATSHGNGRESRMRCLPFLSKVEQPLRSRRPDLRARGPFTVAGLCRSFTGFATSQRVPGGRSEPITRVG